MVGGTAVGLWLDPSGQYLLLPDKATPVEPLVEHPDEDDRRQTDGGGIYMVDILVRKANLLERLFPGVNDGATLIPAEALNPHGVSERAAAPELEPRHDSLAADRGGGGAPRRSATTSQAVPSGAESGHWWSPARRRRAASARAT